MAAVFPDLAACQDNAPAGPTEIPDHPLVRETMRDCLHEAMDIDGLKALVHRFEQGTVRVHFIDTVEPSVLAHEILNGQPFTFLDEDTEIARAPLARGAAAQGPAGGAARAGPARPGRDRAGARPRRPRRCATPTSSTTCCCHWSSRGRAPSGGRSFEALVQAGRSFEVHGPAGRHVGGDRTPARGRGALPGRPLRSRSPASARPGARARRGRGPRGGGELVRGHLDVSGPVTVDELASATGLSPSSVTIALEALRGTGFAVSGHFEPERGEQWCARRLLARIHGYTPRAAQGRRCARSARRNGRPSSSPGGTPRPATRRHGRAGLAEVIEQFQGFEWPAGDWERLFAERVESYRPEWLDDLCLSGEVVWGRLSVVEPAAEGDDPRPGSRAARARRRPARTPITFMLRQDLPWLLQAHRGSRDAGRADRRLGAGGARRPARARRPVPLRSPGHHPSPAHRGRGRPVGRRRPGTRHCRRIQRRPVAAARAHAVRAPPAAQPRDPVPAAGGERGDRASRAAGRCCPPRRRRTTSRSWPRPSHWQLLLRWGVVFRRRLPEGAAVGSVAGGPLGAAPARGARPDPGRALRHRRDRRAVRGGDDRALAAPAPRRLNRRAALTRGHSGGPLRSRVRLRDWAQPEPLLEGDPMSSQDRSQTVAGPASNGETNGKTLGQRLHRFLIPVPKLGPPINPALLKREKERANEGRIGSPMRSPPLRDRCSSSTSTSSGSAAGSASAWRTIRTAS